MDEALISIGDDDPIAVRPSDQEASKQPDVMAEYLKRGDVKDCDVTKIIANDKPVKFVHGDDRKIGSPIRADNVFKEAGKENRFNGRDGVVSPRHRYRNDSMNQFRSKNFRFVEAKKKSKFSYLFQSLSHRPLLPDSLINRSC